LLNNFDKKCEFVITGSHRVLYTLVKVMIAKKSQACQLPALYKGLSYIVNYSRQFVVLRRPFPVTKESPVYLVSV